MLKLKRVLTSYFKNYIFQTLIIFICVSLVLLLYEFFGGMIVASIGASSFILFVTPHVNGSKSRFVIGGYICGSVSGVLSSFLYQAASGYALIFICALAAAFAAFLMITTKSVHPPAAALALGLSVDGSSIKTAAAAIIGACLLCASRYALREYLKNLV